MQLKGKKFKGSLKNYLQLSFQASKSIETNRLIRFKITAGRQLTSHKSFSNYTHLWYDYKLFMLQHDCLSPCIRQILVFCGIHLRPLMKPTKKNYCMGHYSSAINSLYYLLFRPILNAE